MLDLNLNADSPSDNNYTPPLSIAQMESSGSFNSSVVNAADTDDSCSYGDAVAYNFAILNNNTASSSAGESSVRTIQLFPATDSGASPTWLDFSSKVDQHGAAAEQRITPRQPLVKKSRRGPRSRSSQYRGVTFYRRTGRWESHIWDCGKQVYLGEVAIRGFVLDYVFHLSSLSTRGSGRQKRPEEEREGLVRRTWGATSLLVTTWASPKRLMLSGSSLGGCVEEKDSWTRMIKEQRMKRERIQPCRYVFSVGQ